MTAVNVLLPGEVILPEKLPTSKSTAPLKIGPGLYHVPPSTITTTLSGSLQIDLKKNAIWVENAGGRVTY